MYVAIFIASIVVFIMIHEYGHFVTARAFGMKVERFFLGFGPTLWSVQRGETEYGVKALPAGGFVKIVGMTPFEPVDPADRGRRFYEQKAWQRAIVLVSGSATHVIVAVALLFVALAFVGLPTASNTVALVSEGSPAAEAGIRPGDDIVAVAGIPTDDFTSVRDAIQPRGGDTVEIVVQRGGEPLSLETTLAPSDPDGNPVGFLGVGPEAVTRRLPAADAALGTFSGDFSVFRLTSLTVQGLVQAFSPEGIAAWLAQADPDTQRTAEGPLSLVGAGQLAGALGNEGDVFAVLVILAQLNIVLGLLNLLPLPPLDGGHLAVLVVEEAVNGVRRLRGRTGRWRLDPAVITPVAIVVILVFLAISVTAIYIDIVNPASELLQ